MNLRWLFWMTRWAQSPPSAKRVRFFFAVLAICLTLLAIEHFIGWPDILTPNSTRGRMWQTN
ncbi:MAG: hypothetical protein R8G60_01060 [Roseovarius pacificus]|nr:hypothetical protein [Roseovarius pacificus]